MLTPLMHDTPGRDRPGARRQGLEAGRVRADPRQDHAGSRPWSSATTPTSTSASPSLGPLMDKLGNGGKGIGLEHRARGATCSSELNGVVTEEGPTKGLPKIETDIDAAEVILMLAPETNGEVAVKAWAALGKHHRARPHAPRDPEGGREDPLPRRGAQPRKIISSPTWSRHREREGLLQRRLHQRARADPLAHAHRPPAALPGPPVDARLRRGLVRLPPADRHSRPSSR